MNIQEYWQAVGKVLSGLPEGEELWVTSIHNSQRPNHKPGVVALVKRKIAACLIAEQTHRLASPDEIDAYKVDLDRRTRELAAVELASKQQYALPPQLSALVEGILQQQSKPSTKRKEGDS